jgi:CheY-like chemotaxis protein
MVVQASSAAVEIALLEPNKAQQQNPNALKNDATTENNGNFKMFGDDGLTFWDFLDIVNPLQHIPVISTLYRSITGDEIDPAAKIAGGTLYGGPVGAISSLVDVAIDADTGKDIGEHAMTLIQEEHQAIETASLTAITPSTSAASFALTSTASAINSNPYLARAGITEIPTKTLTFTPPLPILAQELANNTGSAHGMRGLPVAKQSYADQLAAYAPVKKTTAAVPDLGLLTDIKHLEQAGLIQTQAKATNAPLDLSPRYSANPVPQQSDPNLTIRLKKADAAYQKMTKTRDSWLIDTMMKGMDGLETIDKPGKSEISASLP